MITWEQIYDYLGITEFIYFISSPSIQEALFPVKIIFIAFTAFFLGMVIWFYRNSSYLKYKFLQDTTEFLSKESYGARKVSRGWKDIKKRAAAGTEAALKLAIIQADELLFETLQDMDYQGATFEELVESAGRKIFLEPERILAAHRLRNDIVYKSDFKIDSESAKGILATFEAAVKSLGASSM